MCHDSVHISTIGDCDYHCRSRHNISIHMLLIEFHAIGELSVLVVNKVYIVDMYMYTLPVESHIIGELSVLAVDDMYIVYCRCIYVLYLN